MYPSLYQKYIEAFKLQMRRQDELNFLLGKYIGFAFHAIKAYPSEPFLTEKKDMDSQDMEAIARNFTKHLGGKII